VKGETVRGAPAASGAPGTPAAGEGILGAAARMSAASTTTDPHSLPAGPIL